MIIREQVIELVKSVFEKHDAETIDTPVFELKVKNYYMTIIRDFTQIFPLALSRYPLIYFIFRKY